MAGRPHDLPKWHLKFWLWLTDNEYVGRKEILTRTQTMIQWIGVLVALLGLAYTGVKDYQKGDIKLPNLPQKQALTKPVYPVQYCLMAYDPNLKKVFYLHENGQWHDFPPQIREYPDQSQEALATSNRPQGASGYRYGQSPQAASYPIRR